MVQPNYINRAQAATIDQGLRSYMLRIYNYVAGALAFCGIIAYVVLTNEAMFARLAPNVMIFGLGAMGISLVAGFGMNRLSVTAMQGLFWGYAACLGVFTAIAIAPYDTQSIARAFFQTAAVFGGMSLYGYTTKKDLSSLGSLLAIGMIGVLLGSVINIFVGSSAFGFALSAIFTIALIGMIAYDTQRLRDVYYEVPAGDMQNKIALYGALSLFANFIMLFLQLLRFFGNQRN
jgi:FtsH-binding integral membrane protein